MPMYLVERTLPGATMEQVGQLHATLEHACSVAREHGTPITYLRSLFTPGESRCRCVFAAPSAEVVRKINDAGGMPYSRIVLAVELVGEPPLRSATQTSTPDHTGHTAHEAKERSK